MNKAYIDQVVKDILNIKTIPLRNLFNPILVKRAMSLGELITNTSKKSIKYVNGCTAELKKAMPKSGRWNFSVICTQPWSEGPYTPRFRLLKKGRKTKGILGREIECSCNCNAWKYNGADYNALNKDYSERQYSDGSAPNKRDKRRKYLICKHIAACVPLLKEFIIPKNFK